MLSTATADEEAVQGLQTTKPLFSTDPKSASNNQPWTMMAGHRRAHKSAKRSRLGNKNRKRPGLKSTAVIDLTDDGDAEAIELADGGDESSSFRLPQPEEHKVSGSPPRRMSDSGEDENRRVVIDLTGVDEMDIDESWVSSRKRKRESLIVDQFSEDKMQLDELNSRPESSGGDVVSSRPRPDWTTSPLVSTKRPYSRDGSDINIAMPVCPPDGSQNFSHESSTSTMGRQKIEGRAEERPKDLRPPDTCFGMLLVDAETDLEAILPTECTPVIVDFSGIIAKLYLQDRDMCIAILVSEPLSRLLDEFTITLTATVCGKKLGSAKNSKRQITDREIAPPSCPVRIFMYGLMDEEDAVGDALSQAGLFLQHPGEHEIDNGFKYHNPQYLLPPGQTMPPIGELKVSLCCRPQTDRDATSRSSLGELERSQLLKIFDSEYDLLLYASIEQSPRLQTKLKRHQLEALVMMVEKEAGVYDNASFPTLWKPSLEHKGRYQHIITSMFEMEKPPPVGGGILADEMGLGKTLSTLSLICHSLDALDKLPASHRKVPRATLVVAPKSTIHAWEKQIQTHIQEGQVGFVIYHGQSRQQELEKGASYDIVLTTYDTLRSDWEKKGPLFSEEWARIVLDEAHKIRNRSSQTFKAVFEISAQKRWCLTGTPIQNSIADFGALLLFVGVPPFNKEGEFAKLVGNRVDTREEGGMDVLRTLIAATTLRRTKAKHAKTLGLTRKTERVEMVELNGRDRKLYEFFKRRSYLIATITKPTVPLKGKGKARAVGSSAKGSNVLVLIGLLRLICNHGEALLPEPAVKAWRSRDANAVDWKMLESGVNKCVVCSSEVDSLDAAESAMGNLACGHIVCIDCAAKSQTTSVLCPRCGRNEPSPLPPPPSPSLLVPAGLESPSTPISSPRSPSGLLKSAPSSQLRERYVLSDKVKALLRNINHSGGVKHVIFSYWTKMLDQIARALKMNGFKCQRIDGQASLQQRRHALAKFNNDPSYHVMLASIGAAGEGIDLTAATTVHIVEPHWNPSAEAQAVDRVHRFGQERDVTVIRYIASDSIEEYVQWVQAEKLRLIKDSLSAADQTEEKVRQMRWNKLLEYLE